MKRFWVKYGVTALVTGIIAVLVFWGRGLFTAGSTSEIYRALSDGFFVAGVLAGGWGILVVASNGGTFDIFSFAFLAFLSLFQRQDKKTKQSFHEYRKAKREKNRSFIHLVIVGLFYIALGLLFAILFSQI